MLFSIIVPVYNVEKYLHKCLDSILDQTFTDYEVIMVDDGSTDNCPSICDEYAEKDSRFKVIHKPNGGLVSARNAGLKAAVGDYICYVDSDDWTKPNMLEFISKKLDESPVKLDMVLFAADEVYTDHVSALLNRVEEGYYDKKRLTEEVYPYMLMNRKNGFHDGDLIRAHTWDKAYRRELQLDCYVRDERIRVFTDVPMTYECMLKSENIYICNERLYVYNKTNEQSIRALSKTDFLRESFGYLVPYLQERMGGYSDAIDQQLNDFPVNLIIRTAMEKLRNGVPFFEAKKQVREGLNTTKMLNYITLKGLPRNPKILIALFKMHLDTAAMALCWAKVNREGERQWLAKRKKEPCASGAG